MLNHSYPQVSLPLLDWFDEFGRKDLPWQHPRSPYHVWISEIMLQQTQVKTVIPYFTRFIARFPDVATLALATEDEVYALWSGLGYYSRARNLRLTAAIIHTSFNGEFPDDLQELVKLPGIGPSTAAAIASLAFNKPTAILDGNVKRVLSRYFLIGGLVDKAPTKQKLWELAQACMPNLRCNDYTQAIMDLGATCCTTNNPNCSACPLQTTCLANLNGDVLNYPTKNPKKSLPTKQQQFLLLHTSDQLIYLEKRPPTGIWGGLWCLPSIDMQQCPASYIYENYKLQTQGIQELMKIKHSFSHFHLHINALTLQTKLATNQLSECPGRWFTYQELETLGLPKPVNDILQYFFVVLN